MATEERLGRKIKLHLSSAYKYHFDKIKAKFEELTHTIVPLIARGIPSLEDVKMFLVKHFNKLAPQLYIVESFEDVMTTMKESCTVINIACFEAIVDHYNIENVRSHITTYKSAVDEICEEFRRDVVVKKNLITGSSSFLKYEEIVFVLGWHRMDDLTFDDIDGLLRKGFENMAKRILFKYGPKRDTERVEWRDDENRVLTISPTTEQCRNIVNRLIKEKQPGKEWCIELRSSSPENALIIISDLDKLSVRELCIDNTPLDSMCMSTLSKKFAKVKKLMFKHFTLPAGGIKQVSDALITNTSLEALLLWHVPITYEDTTHLSNMLSFNTTLQTLDLSNCDISDNDVKNICKSLTKNQTVTILAFSNNLHITSDSTSSIVDLINTNKSLETLYLRNTLLSGDNIRTVCDQLANNTTIQKLVLSEQNETICKSLPKSIKDRVYFVMEEPIGTSSLQGPDKGRVERVEWRDDDSSVLIISPTTKQCRNIVSRLIKEDQPGKEWRIELRSSSPENALIIISDLDKFSVRELCIDDTTLDSRCMLMLSKKFTKVKKLMFKYLTLPTGGIIQLSDALITNTSLEALLMWYVPITDEDTDHLSNMLKHNTTLQTLDLSNCDITDNGVKNICKGLTKNQTVTLLAFTSNLHITSDSTSAIVDLIKATKSLETLYLRNTLLKGDNIKTICDELANNTKIQKLVLSEQHEKICKTLPKSIKDRLYFVKEEPSGADHTSIDREQQQEQSTTNTLSHKQEEIEKITREKATDRVLMEKQEEIEMLTREKEATEKVLIETKELIEKLTREKEGTDRVLVEKQEEIDKLTREKEELFQIAKESVIVDKQDASVQFNYLIPSNDTLKGMYVGGEKLFHIQGDFSQSFNWEQFGLKIAVSEGTLSPLDTSDVAVRALVGGQFQLPEGTELISAVYGISVSKPLLKSVKFEIQHCADLLTEDHTTYLSFVTAPFNSELPYQFELEDGGTFFPGDQYGSIYLSHFSFKAIVKYIMKLFQYPASSGSSSDDEYFDALEPPTQEYGNELSPAKGDSPVMSSGFISIDRLKLLTPSSPTDNKPSSVDISSLEPSPQLPYSSTLLNKQSQTKDESLVNKPFPDNKYVAQTVYEVKCHGTKWLMHFMVAKRLNALLEYIETFFPSDVDKDVRLYFTFEGDSYIELILNEEQEHPFNGWNVYPHQDPVILYKNDVDMFGSEDPPSCPSILITVSAKHGPDTVTEIKYGIPLRGIKPVNRKIYIIRSLGNSRNEETSSTGSANETTQDRGHSSPEEVFRTHYADLSYLVSDSNNRLPLANELFSARLITLECYNSATDNAPKTEMEKGVLLMRGLMTSINTQPQLLQRLINILKKLEVFRSIAENMETDLL